MALLSANDLYKAYGPDDVFSGISLSVPHDARIAIVGPNGIGKTTLLRILIGLEEPTAGTVQRARSLSVGYLPQEAALHGTHTLWEECLRAVQPLLDQEAELSRMEAAMAEAADLDGLLERYGRLQQAFELAGGYTYETRIRQVLTGLGFDEGDFHRPITQLSGGQRTRAVLARLLLAGPDLLVLDEPTNHLDIEAVEWLEGYLSQWPGAALIVSHDRYFLDRVVQVIWEMDRTGLETYRGNYSAYVQQRSERWELARQVYLSEKARLEKELDYIKRNIAGQNTTQAKGRLRRLSREVEAIESLGFQAVQSMSWGEVAGLADISEHTMSVAELESRIKSLRGPSKRPPSLHLQLGSVHRSGDLVLRTRDLEVGYADEGKPLFEAPDLLLKRGETAAVIGPNGAGKTTFLKTLLGQMPPLSGEVIWGASLRIGYFAQAHEDLRPERSLVEEIEASAPNMLIAEIRDYLAKYGFYGDEVFKKVATLSGGERGRLALAKLSLSRANLLLLDEPTNHLDIPSQETLQEVLAGYQGTILLVSHDRYLIDALGTHIWEIEPDEATLTVFKGTYSEYRSAREAEKAAEEAAARERVQARREQQRGSRSTAAGERRRKARLEEVEARIHQAEAELARLGEQLQNPPDDMMKVTEMGEEYARLQEQLAALMNEWEELHLAPEA